MRRLFAAAALSLGLVSGSVAQACLNDTRTEAAEAEFRSRYETAAPATPAMRPTIGGADVWGAAALVAAAGVAAVAVVFAARRRRR